MKKVPLATVSSQSLSFTADGNFWELSIYQAINTMCMDVKVDGNLIETGSRCVGGNLLIPYDYLWGDSIGNLIFDAEPDWERFGIDCNLIYLTQEEAVEWRGLY